MFKKKIQWKLWFSGCVIITLSIFIAPVSTFTFLLSCEKSLSGDSFAVSHVDNDIMSYIFYTETKETHICVIQKTFTFINVILNTTLYETEITLSERCLRRTLQVISPPLLLPFPSTMIHDVCGCFLSWFIH